MGYCPPMRPFQALFGSVVSLLVSCGAPGRAHAPASAALREASGLAMQTCRTAHAGEAHATLSFDERGHVAELRVVPSPDHPVDAEQLQCLEAALRGWSVRPSEQPPSSEVEITLALEPLLPPPTPPPSSNGPPFDRGAAARALAEARRAARACGASGHPSGQGHVTVTFTGSGEIRSVALDHGPFAGTKVGECVTTAYRKERMGPFVGADVKLGSTFDVDPVTE